MPFTPLLSPRIAQTPDGLARMPYRCAVGATAEPGWSEQLCSIRPCVYPLGCESGTSGPRGFSPGEWVPERRHGLVVQRDVEADDVEQLGQPELALVGLVVLDQPEGFVDLAQA